MFMEKRDHYIDICRAIAVLLVIIQHCGIPGTGRIILSFHMPLFFVITGMAMQLSNNTQKKSVYKYSVKRCKQLLAPYFMWEVIVLIMTFILLKCNMGNYYIADLASAIKSIFLCINDSNYRAIIPRLWFLPAAAISSIIVFSMIKFMQKKNEFFIKFKGGGKTFLCSIMVFSFLITILNYYFNSVRLPFTLDISFFAITYTLIGYISFDLINNIRKTTLLKKIIMCIVITPIWFFLLFENDELFLMYINSYGKMIPAFVCSLCGCLLFFIIIDVLETRFYPFFEKPVKWFNINSITIFPLHLIIISFLNKFFMRVMNTWLRTCLVFIFCIVLMYICIWIRDVLIKHCRLLKKY